MDRARSLICRSVSAIALCSLIYIPTEKLQQKVKRRQKGHFFAAWRPKITSDLKQQRTTTVFNLKTVYLCLDTRTSQFTQASVFYSMWDSRQGMGVSWYLHVHNWPGRVSYIPNIYGAWLKFSQVQTGSYLQPSLLPLNNVTLPW